jgi:acyl-CoA thioester hydrolase
MTRPASPPPLEAYPVRSCDTVRYGDTDRQGHVNNAVFATFLESGRVALLYDADRPLAEPGAAFVIARLTLDFLGEITWPGRIDIGTGVSRIGRSSVVLHQGLFQGGVCMATGESVIVQVDQCRRRSTPLSDAAVRHLQGLIGPPAPQGS